MRDHAVEKLFSLFASSERAEALAGDLAEEREQRGWIWFWVHVVRIAFALWRNAAIEAPLRILALATAGCAIFSASAFGGLAAVFLFPMVIDSPASWIALSLFWWSGALWTGASLVAIAPRRGMVACATLAATAQALLIGVGVMALRRDLFDGDFVLFHTTGLLAAAPLLAGGAIARRRMITWGLACVLLAIATPAAAQQGQWHDPSPHKATLVTVEDGVRLEVLDWGGSGPTLLLLAGLSDTAHVFDDVAPVLAKRYRVVGVTRRGHPGSSAPATGYGFARLAEDVVRVMDAVDLKNPIVVGHSFAGEEMHVLGARYSTRIAGLVYVDAAFDRADRFVEHEAAAKALPGPPSPKPADLASFTALRAFLTSTQGPPGPEGRLRARYVGNTDGSVRGRWTPEPHVLKAFSSEIQAAYKTYKPEPIRVPALALYAAPKSADELMRPWYKTDDPVEIRERVERLFPLERENVARHAKWFAAFAERGRVAELSGGHDLFVTNSRDVLEQIDAFVSSLQEKP